MEWIFQLQLLSCWFMFSAIWLVQLLIYPNLQLFEPSRFKEAHARHTFRISFLVGPAMAAELVTAAALVYFAPEWPWILNLLSVITLWSLTQFVSVPLHNRLSRGFDATVITQLTRTNWPRTILWTLRALLLPTLWI